MEEFIPGNTELLTLILAALSALFTLITGALAIGVTIALLYFKKLKNDRQSEIDHLVDLQKQFEDKIKEFDEDSSDSAELENLKKQFQALSTAFAHAVYPGAPLTVKSTDPSNQELKTMVNDLLAQIASLQGQLEMDKKKKTETEQNQSTGSAATSHRS